MSDTEALRAALSERQWRERFRDFLESETPGAERAVMDQAIRFGVAQGQRDMLRQIARLLDHPLEPSAAEEVQTDGQPVD